MRNIRKMIAIMSTDGVETVRHHLALQQDVEVDGSDEHQNSSYSQESEGEEEVGVQ